MAAAHNERRPEPSRCRTADGWKRSSSTSQMPAPPSANGATSSVNAAEGILQSWMLQANVDLGVDGTVQSPHASPTADTFQTNAPSLTPKLSESAPAWWSLPEDVARAASTFDTRYERRYVRAERLHSAAHRDFTSVRKAEAYEQAYSELVATRYVAPSYINPVLHPPKAPAPKSKGRPPFDLHTSVWAYRATWSDPRDFYDTDLAEDQRFRCDWKRACIEQGLAKIIITIHSGDLNGFERNEDIASIGEHCACEEVYDVLKVHRQLLFLIFTYYASLAHSLDALQLNPWSQFVDDCRLASRSAAHCKKADVRAVCNLNARREHPRCRLELEGLTRTHDVPP